MESLVNVVPLQNTLRAVVFLPASSWRSQRAYGHNFRSLNATMVSTQGFQIRQIPHIKGEREFALLIIHSFYFYIKDKMLFLLTHTHTHTPLLD